MGLSRADLTVLLDSFDEFGWSDMVVSVNGARVELTRGGAAPRPGAEAPPTARSPELQQVLASTVGIFYVAPEPGAPPFTEVGRRVAADDVVCVVEVMDLMNQVKAGTDGIVRSVDAEDGTMVEHGQLLFTIEPAA